MMEHIVKLLKRIQILNRFQKELPFLGDYIFGFHYQRDKLSKFLQFTTELVSDFYNKEVSNISLIDLPAFGAIGKANNYLNEDNVYEKTYDQMKANISISYLCMNKANKKFCNVHQTNKIIAESLEKFFKIMLISSTLYTKDDFTDVTNEFINMKAFKDVFSVLAVSEEIKPSRVVTACDFKQTISEDGNDPEHKIGCILMKPILTPLGICSSFNALSFQEVYEDSDYSNAWTSVVKEADEASK